MGNVLTVKTKVKGVTTRRGKMTFEATRSKEINKARINKNEPPRFEQDVQENPHDDDLKNKSSNIRERTNQPLVKPQQSSIPFPNPVLTCLAQQTAINRKRLRSITIPCQVLEKHKEAEELVAYHLSRFENPHMEMLTEREIADKFSDEHLMVLKSKINNDEPWYANFFNYIVGKEEPYAFKLCMDNIMRRCVAGSETLDILAHCHSGPTGGHHSANVTAKKVYESGFYWPGIFKDANEPDKNFKVGDKVLLYNSGLKMYPGKLKSKWSDPNIVNSIYSHGAAEIINKNGFNFKVNGQRLKKYYECDIEKEDDKVMEFEDGVT
nr:reverse transcriptase domain-containing protein [Tanacetum cinerariifolium]GEV87761.1 reverse transcriptase domain-containing protein [Tanacetum cinerariifolium]